MDLWACRLREPLALPATHSAKIGPIKVCAPAGTPKPASDARSRMPVWRPLHHSNIRPARLGEREASRTTCTTEPSNHLTRPLSPHQQVCLFSACSGYMVRWLNVGLIQIVWDFRDGKIPHSDRFGFRYDNVYSSAIPGLDTSRQWQGLGAGQVWALSASLQIVPAVLRLAPRRSA